MEKHVGKFTFKVPDGHPEAGTKIEKTFEFSQVTSVDEANKVLSEKEWNLVDMVNDTLKANARSSAYQAALLPYRPSEVSPEDIKERMIRDFIRLGFPEETARKQVDSLLASQSAGTE